MTIKEKLIPEWRYTYGTLPIDGQSDLTRKMGDYNLGQFVKEIGQNVLDAVLEPDQPIELYFDLIKVSKEHKKKVLEIFGINSENFEKKFDAMSILDANETFRFEKMKKIINEVKDFFILRILDRNTYGLNGDITDKKSRFFGFFWFLGISNKSGSKGGSYGEGRLAILRCSGIQMVMVISHLCDKKIYRKYGSSYHGPFEQENESTEDSEYEDSILYRGIAYYGINPNKIGNRNYPIEYQEYDNKDPLFPEELKEDNFGTSFYYPFYDFSSNFENYENESELISDWTEELLIQIQNWFFPAINAGLLKVLVRFFEFPNISTAKEGRVIKTLDHTNINSAFKIFEDPSRYKSVDISLEIPTERKGERISEKCSLKMVKIKSDSPEYEYLSNYKLHNTLALSRNFMIINYENIRHDFIPEDNFLALVTVKEQNAVEFVRASEPPKHNKWNPNSDRLRHRYTTAGAKSLRDFFKTSKTILREEFGGVDTSSDEIPEHIRKQLLKFIPSELDIEKIKSNKPKTINIKKIEKRRKGTKDLGKKRGTLVPTDTEGPDTPPPGNGPKEGERDTKDGIDEGAKKESIKNINIVEFSKKDILEIVSNLPVSYSSERKSEEGYIEAEISIPEDFKYDFEYIIINPYVLHGTDWLKLPVYINRKLIRYHGLKIKNVNIFPIKVRIDLRKIPRILRALPRIETDAFACKIKGD